MVYAIASINKIADKAQVTLTFTGPEGDALFMALYGAASGEPIAMTPTLEHLLGTLSMAMHEATQLLAEQ
jgi:hypothetical protein